MRIYNLNINKELDSIELGMGILGQRWRDVKYLITDFNDYMERKDKLEKEEREFKFFLLCACYNQVAANHNYFKDDINSPIIPTIERQAILLIMRNIGQELDTECNGNPDFNIVGELVSSDMVASYFCFKLKNSKIITPK